MAWRIGISPWVRQLPKPSTSSEEDIGEPPVFCLAGINKSDGEQMRLCLAGP